MSDDAAVVTMCVPAEGTYARAVRMTAANLAVICEMSVDAVDDVRMAAGEGFVYACATQPTACDITFSLSAKDLSMDFALGDATPADDDLADLDLIGLVLGVVCDDYGISDDGTVLRLVKRMDAAHGE